MSKHPHQRNRIGALRSLRHLRSCAVKRAIGAAVVAVLLMAAVPTDAQAQSWMFRRSYYSHYPVQRVQVGAPVNTRLRYTEPTGAYVRWGWRNSNITGDIRGSYDNFRVYESWIQTGAQY